MAKRVYLDASALAKRYVVEPGTPAINHLFNQVVRGHMLCLTLGTLEVVAIFVRKKNTSVLPVAAFNQAMLDFRSEAIASLDFTKITATDLLVNAATPLVEKHSLNATDAVILRSVLDLTAQLRSVGDDLILVASDQRLLRAARAEGASAFDPETQTTADLDLLLSS